ncbi:glycosyltransferase [Acinetobacter soli]|uniref:glycosyltransferase n=1 Tax=Acinetobacter soli TaxID=487316 RepID=UPI003B9F76A1
MSKTIFSVANSHFLDDKFNEAFILYDYLLTHSTIKSKEIREFYEFNLSLTKEKVNKENFYTNSNELIKVWRALQVLFETNDNENLNFILEIFENKIKSDLFENEDLDILNALNYLKLNFNQDLFSLKNNIRNKYDSTAEYIKKYGIENKNQLRFSIDDMKAKLWGGFSQEVLQILVSSLSSGKYDNKSKANAALILGRWYAVNEQWDLSVKYIKLIKKFDESIFRRKRTKLLLIQSLLNNEDYESAKSIVEFVLNKEFESDYICALTNINFKEFGHSSDNLRLNDLNRIFKNYNLLEINKIKDEKYFFGCWDYNVSESFFINDGPLISILMPVYNSEDFIDVAIKSIINQTWRNIELIVIDDQSTDKTWEKLKELEKIDSRIKLFRNEKNMGAYPTRNKALSLASGEFITVHDSDDWSHPEMLAKQIQPLLDNIEIKATCSFMARVNPDLTFILRPQRENLEFIHRSYPSLLIRKKDIESLGEWDSIAANADDEFIQRLKLKWGNEVIMDVLPKVPLSLFLVHENSLTQQKGTSLSSLTFGIRKTYADQAAYWRKNISCFENLSIQRQSMKKPFPIPQNLAAKNWKRNYEYDVVIISDLSLLGGTRRCNEAYIKNAADNGLRVGIFNWPRFDLKLTNIADEYHELCYHENVDLLVPEDEINTKLVLIHHPPILNYEIDNIPKINTEKVMILVNQSPMQRWSQNPFYYNPSKVDDLCEKLFEIKPTWIAISGRVKKILEGLNGYTNIHNEIWYPPYSFDIDMENYQLPENFGSERKIIIGRHARDHWTKWPQNLSALTDAYCVDNPLFEVNILGGHQTPQKMLNKTPENWNIFEFDSVNVNEFITQLDFFLHFVNEDYIEEFGRNVMEAMALGRVVILPAEFKDIFLDGAVYCDSSEVAEVCLNFWNNPNLYIEQIKKGKRFVNENCSKFIVKNKLTNVLK